MNNVLQVQNVSKQFRIYDRPVDWIREALSFGRKKYHQDFWELRDIHFSVEKGEVLGIIGLNGSGKSTLLQIIAGILIPTTGSVSREETIATILELGSGFNPQFTGRENIFLNAALMGYRRRAIQERVEEIVRFADIGEFIDHPTKLYSSGMLLRLAFAIAVNMDAKIFLMDEILAVGDILFQRKCFSKLEQLKERGATIIFVSHDLATVHHLCNRCLLLEKGRIEEDSDPVKVIELYHAKRYRAEAKDMSKIEGDWEFKAQRNDNSLRYGFGKARIEDFYLADQRGGRIEAVQIGSKCKVIGTIEAVEDHPEMIAGFMVKDVFGTDLIGATNYYTKEKIPVQKKGDRVRIEFELEMPLAQGHYFLSFGVGELSDGKLLQHDNWINEIQFQVIGDGSPCVGYYRLPVQMRICQSP